uniref:Uncharacterized protein n=1 Tax=Cannabis sativa TaxID=3483 RepID=A0A803Q047_CANSA
MCRVPLYDPHMAMVVIRAQVRMEEETTQPHVDAEPEIDSRDESFDVESELEEVAPVRRTRYRTCFVFPHCPLGHCNAQGNPLNGLSKPSELRLDHVLEQSLELEILDAKPPRAHKPLQTGWRGLGATLNMGWVMLLHQFFLDVAAYFEMCPTQLMLKSMYRELGWPPPTPYEIGYYLDLKSAPKQSGTRYFFISARLGTNGWVTITAQPCQREEREGSLAALGYQRSKGPLDEPTGFVKAKVARTFHGEDAVGPSLPPAPLGSAPIGQPMILPTGQGTQGPSRGAGLASHLASCMWLAGLRSSLWGLAGNSSPNGGLTDQCCVSNTDVVLLCFQALMKLSSACDGFRGYSYAFQEHVKILEASLVTKDKANFELEILLAERQRMVFGLGTMLGARNAENTAHTALIFWLQTELDDHKKKL